MPHPNAAEIESAARLLRAGRLVAFPTETVYGLGANALDPEAVARIYQVKGRPPASPLIVHIDSMEMAKSLVTSWPENAEILTQHFWPGPLTLVLNARVGPGIRAAEAEHISTPSIPLIVTAGLHTVGLRMPSHPVALALIKAAGVPLAAPSANRFTQLSPTTADHVRQGLGNDVDLILDGGACQVGIESTVISLTGAQPVLLRPGGIPRAQIEAMIGPLAVAEEISSGAHPAPGMHARHYSPRTRLLIVKNGEVPSQGSGVYLKHRHNPNRSDIDIVLMPARADQYASALYRQLHEADASGHEWIAVDPPPQSPEWEAIHDRLRRAAS